MSTSPLNIQTKVFLSVAPGLHIHCLDDGDVWVESENSLFNPIYLGNRTDTPGIASDSSLPAMKAVMRLSHIQPEVDSALRALEPNAKTVFLPAPGYAVLASHAESPGGKKGWYVEDSFGQFNASEDHESAWDACVAAVRHHLDNEPSPEAVLDAASEHIGNDNRIVLDDRAKVTREPGNPFRGAWVPARIWVKDADINSKTVLDDIPVVST